MVSEKILEKLMPINDEEKHLIDGGDIEKSLYMDSDNVVNSKKMLSAGKLITVRSHPRFAYFPEHTHDYIEVVYMCCGSTTHVVDGEKIELKEGNLLFLSQNAKQEILPAKMEDIAINFIILPEFLDTVLQMLGEEETLLRRFVVECLKGKGSSAGYLLFEVSDVLPIQNLVENLIWTLIYETPNKRRINQTTMGLLFLQLINHTDRLVSRSEEERVLIKTLRYIEEHYRDGSLSELSKLLHYDLCNLSREIKRRSNKTYTELLQEKRISQACYFLKNTDLNVDDIAIKVGYDNISYFHRLFRRATGVSPKKYRNNENCK